MTCKECVYQPMCYKIEHYGRDIETDEICSEFVNADKLINSPVIIGDFLYSVCIGDDVDGNFISKFEVIGVSHDGIWLDDGDWFIPNDRIGKDFFVTYEEANKAFKGYESNGH